MYLFPNTEQMRQRRSRFPIEWVCRLFLFGSVVLLWAIFSVTGRAADPGTTLPASAAAGQQKAGSILIFNFYTSTATTTIANQDTEITFVNTHPTLSAFLHLFFVAENGPVADRFLCIEANQTYSILASTVDPGISGYLVAVAVNSDGCPVSHNFLMGDAQIKLSTGHFARLSAIAVSALFSGTLPGCSGSLTTATLAFNGSSTGYNQLPRALVLDNIGSRADGNDTLLILNRIGGNLALGAGTLGTLFGLIYDDAANSLSFELSGSAQFRSTLSSSFPRLTPRFDSFIPAGRSGWMKIYGQTPNDIALLGAAINFNANATPGPTGTAGAYSGGQNLHFSTVTATASYVIPVFPPTCNTPTLSSLSPSSAATGGAAFTLTVNGGNFTSNSVVRWNGADRPTTFVSGGQLRAQIPASDLAAAGTAGVTVFRPFTTTDPALGLPSSGLSFTVGASQCTYSIQPTSQSFSAGGGTGSVNVTSTAGCTWTATSNSSWLTITSGASGSGSGAVGYSVALNAGTTSRTGTLTIAGQTFTVTQSGAGTLAAVSTASFSASTGLAPESLATCFGNGLATSVAVATALPLPTTLSGSIVTVRDAAGVDRSAPLFFVSPNQINFQVPAGTGIGTATIIVRSGSGSVFAGSAQIASVAPGIFSKNSTGTGAAFGNALRVKGDGSQSFEILSEASGAARTINLGPPSDQVSLLLHGTGIRGRSSLTNVTAKIGGVDAPVSYAGTVTDTPFVVTPNAGEDQVNVSVPRSLAGRGLVDVVVTVDGKVANTVQVSIGTATDAPAVASISPASPTVSSGSQSITVNGTGFQSGLTVTLIAPGGGSTTVSGAQIQNLTAVSFVMSATLATAGTWSLRVNNPDGGQSTIFGFTVGSSANPLPSLSSISPSAATAGASAFTLTVNGSNFVSGAIVRWNGANRTTTFVSSTQLTAQISASDITAAGSASITVSNPAPGGGVSNALTFTVNPACTYSINPTNQSFAATTGVGSVTVTAGSGCAWTATSNASWITITSGASGSGNGTVGYAVAANTGAARSGTITIAGQAFTVTQGCNATAITTQPAGQTVCPGSAVSFSVTATGAGNLSYQWRKNGVNIAGATTSTFNIPAATGGDAGSYSVAVTGACDSVTSNVATLTVNTPPVVTTNPANQSVAPGAAATFTAAASGSPSPTVQWQVSTDGLNFNNLSGATSANLTLNNVTLSQNGNRYRAVFSNSCGSATSTAATLSVGCPSINLTPTTLLSGTVGTNYSQVFTANGGTAPYSFRVSAGSLPLGMTLSATSGTFSGTPTQGGTFNFTVTATDANGCTGSRGYSLTIACALDISPKAKSFTASGGTDSVSVIAGGGCAWTAVSNDNWISLTGATSGTGDSLVTYSVAVYTGTIQRTGTLTVAGQTFTVTQSGVALNPTPVIGGLSPSTVTAGGGAFTLIVNGSNFVSGASVQWNGSNRQTTVVSASQLTAQIPATDIAAAGTVQITVVNPPPGGGPSAATVLTILPAGSGFAISGRVSYADAGLAAVPGVTVGASSLGITTSSAPSGNDGRYVIQGLARGTYRLRAQKTGNVNGISALDAARILQRQINNEPFVGLQRRAADLDGNDTVDERDALLIANFVVGINGGQAGNWFLEAVNDSTVDVTGNLSDQNFRSALIGDVSGNWLPEASLSIGEVTPLTLNLKNPETGGVVNLPGLKITGTGFAAGLTLLLKPPNGGELQMRESQLLEIKSDSFTAPTALNASGLWALQVINADGRRSDVFVLKVE